MALVNAVIALALVEYFLFAMAVGAARGKYKVAAPATTGNPDFERVFRVQQNTLETLIIFIPSMWLFGEYVSTQWAAGLGLAYIVGRAWYFFGYRAEARKRSAGYGLSMLPVLVLMFGGLIGAVRAAL